MPVGWIGFKHLILLSSYHAHPDFYNRSLLQVSLQYQVKIAYHPDRVPVCCSANLVTKFQSRPSRSYTLRWPVPSHLLLSVFVIIWCKGKDSNLQPPNLCPGLPSLRCLLHIWYGVRDSNSQPIA